MVIGEATPLEYKMSKGEVLSYKTAIHSLQEIKTEEQSGSVTSDVEMKMVQKCTDVSSDGVMTVDVIIESGVLKRDGQTEELPNVGQTVTIKMKKSGEIIHTSVDLPFEQPAFPSNSVKKGDSWIGKSKISVPGKSELIGLEYNYTLADFVKMLGEDCAEITVVCPETKIPIGEGIEQTLTANGKTYFANKEGRLIKSEVETKTMITAQDGSVNTVIKVSVELEGNKAGGMETPDVGYIIK